MTLLSSTCLVSRARRINIDTCDIATVAFTSPELLDAAARFAPAILRVGGTAANELFVNFSGSDPTANGIRPWSPDDFDHSNTTVPAALWDALYTFAETTGLRLLWDLNVLGSRFASNNTWDPTNTIQLFKHIVSTNKTNPAVIAGFQFGNEPFLHDVNKDGPSWVTGEQLAADFLELQSIAEAHGVLKQGAILQAPDSCCAPFDRILLESFVKGVAAPGGTDTTHPTPPPLYRDPPPSAALLNQASFHLYSNPSTCDNPAALIDPAHASVTMQQMKAYRDAIVNAGHSGEVVLSETAGHSAGGCANITDAFVSSLWFVDWLGTAARQGIAQVYRQKLVGSDRYDLITLPARGADPPFHRNPDYYTSLLWRKLVGPAILDASAIQLSSPMPQTIAAAAPATKLPTLRLTAACTPAAQSAGIPQNVVVVIYSNWKATAVGNVTFTFRTNGTESSNEYRGPATLFGLESGAAAVFKGDVYARSRTARSSSSAAASVELLESKSMLLNGKLLTKNSSLVGLPIPIPAASESATAVHIPGYSLGFVVLNEMHC